MLRGLALATLPVLLMAQEPGPEDLKDLQDILKQPVISSASKRLQRLKEAPVDATILSREDLHRLGYHTLSEALDGVLGFRTVRDRANDTFAVRGLKIAGDVSTRVLILLDGHTLNSDDSFLISMIGEDLGIPLDCVERIEITRGPASALYGNTAFLGMVNVVTRAPVGGAEAALEGQSRGGFGGWGRAGWTTTGATWDITATGWQQKGTALDFPELGVGTLPADLDREERQSAYLRAQGKDWSLAGYAMSNLRRLAAAPYDSVIGDPANHYKDSVLFGEFKAEPKFGQVKTLLRVFADHHVFSDVFDYDGFRAPGFTLPFVERDPSQGYGFEVQARFPVTNSQFLTVGSEQKWGQLRSIGINEGLPFGNRIQSQSGNTYAQLDSTVNSWMNLVLGLQLASQKILRAEQFFSGQEIAFPQSNHQEVTPRFALILNPTSIDILKVLYGGGYRYATLFERFYQDGQSTEANSNLQPERIYTGQVIWVRTWGDGIQSQIGWSDSRWDGLIQYQDTGDGSEQARNLPGTIRGRAAEAELLGRQPGWTWMLQGGYYNWTQGDGTPFPDCAHYQGGLRITRFWGPWSATTEARYVSRREGDSPGVAAPATTTFRVALRWEGPHAWVSAAMEDLTDARRVDLVPLENAPITRMASDGRTWRISLGWRF